MHRLSACRRRSQLSWFAWSLMREIIFLDLDCYLMDLEGSSSNSRKEYSKGQCKKSHWGQFLNLFQELIHHALTCSYEWNIRARSLEEGVDIHAILLLLLLLLGRLGDLLLLFYVDLLLELHKLILELILIVVHIVILGQHLIHQVALHLQVQHLISEVLHFIDVDVLHGRLLPLHRAFQSLILHKISLTISLCPLAASTLNAACCSIFWCEL